MYFAMVKRKRINKGYDGWGFIFLVLFAYKNQYDLQAIIIIGNVHEGPGTILHYNDRGAFLTLGAGSCVCVCVLSGMGTVRDGNYPGWELSTWWELSGMGIVRIPVFLGR